MLHCLSLHGLGLITLQKGKLQNAKEFLEAAVRIQPNSLRWIALGNCYQSDREFSQAVDAYEKALATGCNIAPLHNNLGYALQKLGEWEKAAIEIQPDCREAYVNLGNALYANGQISKDKRPLLAAAIATMKVFRQEDVIGQLYQKGERLRKGINRAIANHQLQDYFQVVGKPCNLVYATRDRNKQASQAFRTLFLQETIKRGLIMPSIVVSFSHSDRDITVPS